MLPRMNLNFWSFCFHLLSTGLTWATMSTSLQILNLLPSFLSVYKGSSKLHSRVMLLAHTMVAEGVCKLWLYRTTHCWWSNWDKNGKSNASEWPNCLFFLFQKFYFYLLFVCVRETEKERDWETERVTERGKEIERGKGREVERGRGGREEGAAHVCHRMCGCQRKTWWSRHSPSTFAQFPETKLRSPGLWLNVPTVNLF